MNSRNVFIPFTILGTGQLHTVSILEEPVQIPCSETAYPRYVDSYLKKKHIWMPSVSDCLSEVSKIHPPAFKDVPQMMRRRHQCCLDI